MTHLFNKILTTKEIFIQWAKFTSKKGGENKINNYRLISLMSNDYKVF